MTLHIEIINGNKNTLCQSKCGSDWSNPEIQTQVADELVKRYGDCIRIKYSCSVSKNVTGAENSLLIINGQVRLSGAFDERELMDLIETQLEIGRWADARG
jgi:hypothetical protein